MIPLDIQFVAKDEMISWPAVTPETMIHVRNDPPLKIAVLDEGMESGKPSIMLRIDLPDGKTVIAETSARLFCIAARAIVAKYPTLFDD